VSIAARREKMKMKKLDSSSVAILKKNRVDKKLSDTKYRHHMDTCLLPICDYTRKEVLEELITSKMRLVGLQLGNVEERNLLGKSFPPSTISQIFGRIKLT
jgi:hypothetical protein